MSLSQIAKIVSVQVEKQNDLDNNFIIEPKPHTFSNFILDKNKVTFLFQRYQILSGAYGSQKISIQRK
jgi:hypothetical protein